MIDGKREELHKCRFCLCDCEKEQEEAMEEYFRNELFSDKTVDVTEDPSDGNG